MWHPGTHKLSSPTRVTQHVLLFTNTCNTTRMAGASSLVAQDMLGAVLQEVDAAALCPSLGASFLAAQDVLEAVLQEVDAAALCQLKAVSVAWCTQARRELCNRLCRREGQPETAGVAGITDLDVAVLSDAGRPWEVVVAGRQLPQPCQLRQLATCDHHLPPTHQHSHTAKQNTHGHARECVSPPRGGGTEVPCRRGRNKKREF